MPTSVYLGLTALNLLEKNGKLSTDPGLEAEVFSRKIYVPFESEQMDRINKHNWTI